MKIRLLKVETYDIRRDTMEVVCGEFEIIEDNKDDSQRTSIKNERIDEEWRFK